MVGGRTERGRVVQCPVRGVGGCLSRERERRDVHALGLYDSGPDLIADVGRHLGVEGPRNPYRYGRAYRSRRSRLRNCATRR